MKTETKSKGYWWRRYEIWLAGKVFHFFYKKDARWAYLLAKHNGLDDEVRAWDRWTGEELYW